VVVETLRQLGLTDELARLLPRGESEVAPDRIVEALVVQRCLEPESKLQAVRWFPNTALPELLGVSPAQFNNTRIHRVLEQLEGTEQELMRAVSRCCHEQHGRFATLFLDITDTWFMGDGPELAKRGKVKEGMVRQKIGIVLLCSEKGHPLRWEVLEGCSAEGPAMRSCDANRAARPVARADPDRGGSRDGVQRIHLRAAGREGTIRHRLDRAGVR